MSSLADQMNFAYQQNDRASLHPPLESTRQTRFGPTDEGPAGRDYLTTAEAFRLSHEVDSLKEKIAAQEEQISQLQQQPQAPVPAPYGNIGGLLELLVNALVSLSPNAVRFLTLVITTSIR